MNKVWTVLRMIVSALLAALGALWFLQGTGLVVIDPIACVGDCQPLRGPSALWSAVGGLTLAFGGWSLARNLSAYRRQ